MVRSLLVLVGALAASAAAYPNPGKVAGSTQVHDPTMCKDSAGTYFVFGACYLSLTRRAKSLTGS